MKYKQSCLLEVQKLPINIQKSCIDYKQWKKTIKTLRDEATIKAMLEKDMRNADNVFKQACEQIWHKDKMIKNLTRFGFMKCCMVLPDDPYNSSYIKTFYKFAHINSTSLYKLTKKCDKKLGTHLRTWYIQERNKYAMCGGVDLKRLELDIFGYKDECPICYEVPTNMIILDCGHIMCLTCLKQIYKIDHMKGTLPNLIQYALYTYPKETKCPVCRLSKPITSYTNKRFVSANLEK